MRATARRLARPVIRFVELESSSSILLLGATIIALVWANSPWSSTYTDLLHRSVVVGTGSNALHLTVHEIVDDALMAVFFLVVGLEIKREFVQGELRDRRTAALPILAALGGMAVPALLYFVINAGTPASHGWGIPMATDIAFALGVVAAFGRRLPPSLRLFLLSLAVVDDLGAIVVIAVFYSSSVSFSWLVAAVGVLALLLVLRALRIATIVPYLVVGLVAWYCMFRSGVHATIAGVAVGLLIPLAPVRRDGTGGSLATRLEDHLHPWTSYLIIPVFALANAGVALGGGAIVDTVTSRVGLGVIVGLVVGKAIGVGGASLLAVRLGVANRPTGTSTVHLLGAALVAGIGFTVSLFVAQLAFTDPALTETARLSVLLASATAAILAFATFGVSARRQRAVVDESASDADVA